MLWIEFGIRRICVESLAWTGSGHEGAGIAKFSSRRAIFPEAFLGLSPGLCPSGILGEVFHVEQLTLLYVQYCALRRINYESDGAKINLIFGFRESG